jgi:hypothetical protein
MLSVADGALFGNRDPQDERRLIMRTFISDETMQEGYKARFKKAFANNISEGIAILKDLGFNHDALEASLMLKK